MSYGCEFTCGWVSGMGGILVGHPIDTIKVKQQITGSSVTATLLEIYHARGIPGYFRGLSAPLLLYGTLNSLFFGSYEMAMTQCQKSAYFENKKHYYEQVFLAGCLGGAAQLILGCPIDLIKVQLQGHQKDKSLRGPFDILTRVIKANGIFGLYKGIIPQAYRDIPSAGIYFAAYEYGKDVLCPDAEPEKLAQFIAGGVAGTLSWVSILPLDVIKSNIQGDKIGASKFVGIKDCTAFIWKNEGLKGFFRGFWPLCIRAFPVNGTTFLLYEYLLGQCNNANRSPQFL